MHSAHWGVRLVELCDLNYLCEIETEYENAFGLFFRV